MVVYAKVCRKTERPPGSKVELLVENHEEKFLWKDFRKLSGAIEALGDEWDQIEQETRREPLEEDQGNLWTSCCSM